MSLFEFFVDGSYVNGYGGIGIYARKNGIVFAEISKTIPIQSENNQECEFYALYEGLLIIQKMLNEGTIKLSDNIIIYSDSQSSIYQLRKTSRGRAFRKWTTKINDLIEELKIDIAVKWIRSENIYHQQADELSKESYYNV